MKRTIPKEIRNGRGERLDFTYHPGAEEISTLVVLAHDVRGDKDQPLLVELGSFLARTGIHAVRFSFAGHGASEGRLEAASVAREIEDFGAVLDALPGWHVGCAGHGFGAAIGVLRTATDSRIHFLITLAARAHFAGLAQPESGNAGPVADGSVTDAARRLRVPWLLLHGLADDMVSSQDSRDLFSAATEPKRLIEMPEADHEFSGQHTREAGSAIVAWMRQLKL